MVHYRAVMITELILAKVKD